MEETRADTIYNLGSILDDIYIIKKKLPSYSKGWKMEEPMEAKESKCQLFWMEVLYLFQTKLLTMKNPITIRLKVELDRREGTVLYRFDTDPKGEKRSFISLKYEPQLLWDIHQSPIGGIGLIRKNISESKVVLELWFPV